ELGPVRKDGDGCVAERALDLGCREVAETPLCTVARLLSIAVDGLQWIARDQQACPIDLLHRCDRVAESLVGADHAEREDRPPVVGPRWIAREHGMRDHARVDPELRKRAAAVLAVYD